MNSLNDKKEIAEKVIPVTDSLHARLSELKGKERCTFNDLIERMFSAFERENLAKEIELDKGEPVEA